MKYVLLIFLFITNIVLAQKKVTFIKKNQLIDEIDFKYVNNLPFIKVNIKGKDYNLLVDTGAPTYISTTILKDLNTKINGFSRMRDSQNNKENISFTIVPNIKVGNTIFKNIEAHVYDFKGFEFDCLKIDGIIGENLMASVIWKIDYSEKKITITDDLVNFELNDYLIKTPFLTDDQKTPLLPIKIKNNLINFKLDTGSTGRISVNRDIISIKDFKKINMRGIQSISAFGKTEIADNYYFKIDSIEIGDSIFENNIFISSEKNLIGNKFLENFSLIIDWKENYIYLKKGENKLLNKFVDSFGFGYLFKNNRAYVQILLEQESELKFGDEIIRIDEIDFTNLNKEKACNLFINDIFKDKSKITLKIKRGDGFYDFVLDKKRLLE